MYDLRPSNGKRVFFKSLNDSHYKTYHSEYAQCLRRWVKTFVTVGTIDVLILGILFYLLYHYWTPNDVPIFTALIIYLVPLWFLIIRYYQKAGFFDREWREQHPDLTQTST